MTYQAFATHNPLNIIDSESIRDFNIIIPEGKYITQDEIYFNIEYTNINYNKIENIYINYLTKSQSLGFDKNINSLKEYKIKINELIDSTIKDIENEHSLAKDRQTPLFMFRSVELFVDNTSIARSAFYSLDEMINDNCLYLNQIFPGIKFRYNHENQLIIRFSRAPIKNECLKFECHFNCNDITKGMNFGLITGYKEYLVPGGFITGDIQIEPDVKSFKMIPCVSFTFYKKFENKDYKKEAEKMINEYYNKMKLKYYKDGLEINETEFGTSPGLYHIEILNKDEFKNKADFYRIDYKIICEC